MLSIRPRAWWPVLVILGVAFVKTGDCRITIPEPKVEILLPRGLRASIPDIAGLSQLVFHGAVNRSLEGMQIGDFYGEISEPINGRWVYENMDVSLTTGDVLNFWVHIKHNEDVYRLFGRSITVPELRPVPVENANHVSPSTKPNYECLEATTTARPPIQADRLKVTICLTTSTP